jgi:hypothetical protein
MSQLIRIRIGPNAGIDLVGFYRTLLPLITDLRECELEEEWEVKSPYQPYELHSVLKKHVSPETLLAVELVTVDPLILDEAA